MRIMDKSDLISKWYYKISGEDFREWSVKLNKQEFYIGGMR